MASFHCWCHHDNNDHYLSVYIYEFKSECLQVMKSQRSKSLHEAEDLVTISHQQFIIIFTTAIITIIVIFVKMFSSIIARLVVDIVKSFTLLILIMMMTRVKMIMVAHRWECSWGRSKKFRGNIAQFPSTGSLFSPPRRAFYVIMRQYGSASAFSNDAVSQQLLWIPAQTTSYNLSERTHISRRSCFFLIIDQNQNHQDHVCEEMHHHCNAMQCIDLNSYFKTGEHHGGLHPERVQERVEEQRHRLCLGQWDCSRGCGQRAEAYWREHSKVSW